MTSREWSVFSNARSQKLDRKPRATAEVPWCRSIFGSVDPAIGLPLRIDFVLRAEDRADTVARVVFPQVHCNGPLPAPSGGVSAFIQAA